MWVNGYAEELIAGQKHFARAAETRWGIENQRRPRFRVGRIGI